MIANPTNHKGYKLLHEGLIALAQVEAYGMRVDVEYLDRQIKSTETQMRLVEDDMRKSDVWRVWRKRFGQKANMGSRDQLATILYKHLGYTPTVFTESGSPSADVEALEHIKLPFIKQYINLAKLDKAHGTYLKGIRREVVGDRIHPVFNLHTVVTYRSSSDTPNFQNFPVRDPEVAKLIRRCFIPSKGCVIVENDYAGVEVKVAACYHKDPVMLTYIRDPSKDMHRDMAAQIYHLESDWIKANGKNHRYAAKNQFVFPQFYGDYYVNCARSLWEYMLRAELKGPNGEPLADHLRKYKIKDLGKCDPKERPVKGTFEHHLKEVENDFWNKRFMVYGQWKKDWYGDYLRTGGFDTLTGFRIEGHLKRNEVINYPVQGAAFHCLLWSLIRINKLLRKYKMKSRIAGQIHDSLIGDVRTNELKDYLDLVRDVMTEQIKKEYTWLIVPLEIENEICPEHGTWYDKMVVERKDDIYTFTPKGAKEKKVVTSADEFLAELNREYLKTKAA